MTPKWLHTGLWVFVLAALVLVFALYVQADFVVTLANQIWVCF